MNRLKTIIKKIYLFFKKLISKIINLVKSFLRNRSLLLILVKLIIGICLIAITYKYSASLYLTGLMVYAVIMFIFFTYKEIFIISLFGLLACAILFLIGYQLFYEKVGEFVFVGLIVAMIKSLAGVRKDALVEEH